MAVTLQEASDRLEEAGLRLSDRYARGTSGKGGAWASGAAKAEKNYEDGITQAVASKKWGKGISSAGASAYDQGVTGKGVRNWGPGLQDAGSKYQRKTQKFAGLWNQPLSTPRGSKRSASNLKRMQENVDRFSNAAK